MELFNFFNGLIGIKNKYFLCIIEILDDKFPLIYIFLYKIFFVLSCHLKVYHSNLVGFIVERRIYVSAKMKRLTRNLADINLCE